MPNPPPPARPMRRMHLDFAEEGGESLLQRYDLLCTPDLRNLVDGRLEHMPRGSHQICGHCELPHALCRCRSEEPLLDYVYVDTLPPPAADATTLMLLNRWASLVEASPSMFAIKAKRFVEDQGGVFVAAAEVTAELFDDMCAEYICGLPTDPIAPRFLSVLGYGDLPGLPPLAPGSAGNGPEALAAEVLAAKRAFLAGDWATITKLGAVLLDNAFQASDPEKYSIEDAGLSALYDGVGLVGAAMYAGYSDIGWRLSLEYFRAPMPARGMPSAHARDYMKRRMRAATGETTPDDMSLASMAMGERLRVAKPMLIT